MAGKAHLVPRVLTGLLLTLLLAVSAACGGQAGKNLAGDPAGAGTTGKPLEFEVVDNVAELPTPIQEWLDLFRVIGGLDTLTVDGYTYLLVALGERPTGGYAVEIERVAEPYPGGCRVWYRTRSPKPGEFVTQAFTYPYALVRVAARTDDCRFLHSRHEGGPAPVRTGSLRIEPELAARLQAHVDAGHSTWLTDPLEAAQRLGIAVGFSPDAEFQLLAPADKGAAAAGRAEVRVTQDGASYIVELIQPNGPDPHGIWLLSGVGRGSK